MTVEIVPVEGLPEIRPGDDLAGVLSSAIHDLRDGDVVAVTQKVVSKAEGRVVSDDEGHDTWVARETRRVVARRGDLVIAETAHGFVCANAGVDASNVELGSLTLLPEDPDGSAERIRRRLADERGVDVGVVITDTFGRPWRTGLVNVAIGCAGLPALLDLRGTKDHQGRVLEATEIALADEVAAASGLVMGKDAMIPAAVVRGLTISAPPGRGADLVRPAEEDLFRESPLQSIHARRQAVAFGPGDVPRASIEEAVRAALAADGATRLLFLVLESDASRRRFLAAGRTDALLSQAPVLIVPAMKPAEREDSLLAAGAAVQTLVLALHAQGLASRWAPLASISAQEARTAVGLEDEWDPVGVVAIGRMP